MLIKVFKTLLLMVLAFAIGFTYSEYRHKDEETTVVEFFIDGAGNVVGYVAHMFDETDNLYDEINNVDDEVDKVDGEINNADDEVDKVDGEINNTDDEADKVDGEINNVDDKQDIVDDETDDYLNLGMSKVNDFIETVTPKKPVTKFVEPTSYKPMIKYEDINYPSEPKTVEDFEKVFLYMANQGVLDLELYYSTAQNSTVILGNTTTAFENITEKYIELFSNIRYNENLISNKKNSASLKIKLSNQSIDDITLLSQEQYFQKRASQINDALHEKKFITDDMTQKEVAKELYRYVTRTLQYDTNFNEVSYSGYGAVTNDMAVCQGYTALYNYLLKLNGIDCEGQKGESLENGVGHIWTVAILDGKTSYIDVTFGDPIPDRVGYTNYEYFNVSKEFLSQDRSGVE